MKDFTIAIYCFIDDLLLKIDNNPIDKRRKLSNSQVITTVILSAKYFYGNQMSACGYLESHYGFSIPDKSNFNRILHSLTELIAELFSTLGVIFKKLNLESVYLIDSFPVSVCKNIRICRTKLIKGQEFRGYNTSKREYFYGFKVHLITTGKGIPVECMITAGSVHDNTSFQMMDINLPKNGDLYGDAAYINQQHKELLLEFNQIRLKVATKKNSVIKNTWAEELENRYYRKTIENTFADITAKLPKKIHAVTAKGFLLKILCFIIMYILDRQF
ncbi:IS982 family transposase [Arcicella aquatica]|uniref:IS982 family transposase n=1 Tax=Arcicella aquatica TaxID=217141 RepID=A0ABU5QVJ6_9BACT|nr:IS982 family transposase [Arcicella aquatica]MEA5261078.1 IS982 family transposase [Arcicella aquatica]